MGCLLKIKLVASNEFAVCTNTTNFLSVGQLLVHFVNKEYAFLKETPCPRPQALSECICHQGGRPVHPRLPVAQHPLCSRCRCPAHAPAAACARLQLGQHQELSRGPLQADFTGAHPRHLVASDGDREDRCTVVSLQHAGE